MNIIFVHPSCELYGADKILLYILTILCERNEITVILPNSGILIEHIRSISPKINISICEYLPIVHSKLRFFDYIRIPFKIVKTAKLFYTKKFDYCFCNTLATALVLFTVFFRNKVLYVHEIIQNTVLNFIFSIIAKIGAKRVICVSDCVKNRLLWSKDYISIHNGIPDIVKCFSKNNTGHMEKLRFALPGRFMPQKGQWFVIEALKLIPAEVRSKIRIDLYGSAPPFKQEFSLLLKEEVEKNEFSQIIFIHPFVSNIFDIYSNANIILVPSLMPDPFPTTVLESLMFSKPVITTSNGGACEVLDSTFAKLVAPGDIKELASAICFFVNNIYLLPVYSEKARERFISYLTLDKYAERFFKVFGDLKSGSKI